MDHWKAERVNYRNGIRDFRGLGQSKTQKLSSVQLLFCPETEFSSEVSLQNSVTFKLFSRHGRMTNRWRAGRVTQVFDGQVRDRI
jgi:hypothetical protein